MHFHGMFRRAAFHRDMSDFWAPLEVEDFQRRCHLDLRDAGIGHS
jgi:hypothetical protein